MLQAIMTVQALPQYIEEDVENEDHKAANGNLAIKEVQGRIRATTDDISQKDKTDVTTYPLCQPILDHLRDFYMGMKTDIPPFQYYNSNLFERNFEIFIDKNDEESAIREMYALIERDPVYDHYVGNYCFEDDGKFYVHHFKRRKDDYKNNPAGKTIGNLPVKKKRFTQLVTELGGDGAGIYQKYLSGSVTYYCSWGNSIEHKNRFAECLLQINTCQKKENARNVSAGYGSIFTNGYCQLLYIFYDPERTKFAGRMIVRELHDPTTNQVYMFMDRLYSKGQLSNSISDTYRKIMERFILQGIRVVIPTVTNSGGQVSPVYRYIEKRVVTKPLVVEAGDLITGLYKCVLVDDEYAGYYNDSKTLTIQTLVNKKVRHLDYMSLIDERSGNASMLEVTAVK